MAASRLGALRWTMRGLAVFAAHSRRACRKGKEAPTDVRRLRRCGPRPRRAAARIARPAGDDRAIAHRGPDEEGHHLAAGSRWERAAELIDPSRATSRSATRTGSYGRSSTARSSTSPSSVDELRSRPSSEDRGRHRDDRPPLRAARRRLRPRLRGMFAIAVGTSRDGGWSSRATAWASSRSTTPASPAACVLLGGQVLLAGGLPGGAPRPGAAELYLAYGYVPGSEDAVRGGQQAAAGHGARMGGRRARGGSVLDACRTGCGRRAVPGRRTRRELLAHLRRSVRARMVSDVPIGVMLSGGLDSSLVTALMCEASGEPVKTFSVGFAGRGDQRAGGSAPRRDAPGHRAPRAPDQSR